MLLIVLLMAIGMCFLFARYRKLHSNQTLFSRNEDSSNVNEQIQINDNIYIYDEINDLDLDEMNTINTLNHELTSGASIIDIDDMGYEMPSKWMTVDENINDSARSSTTLTEDDNSLKLDRDIADSGYLNPYQPLSANWTFSV